MMATSFNYPSSKGVPMHVWLLLVWFVAPWMTRAHAPADGRVPAGRGVYHVMDGNFPPPPPASAPLKK